jgi:peptide alpha-N-acetyltransferase
MLTYIQTGETILKKFPNHGETLAMKGLVLVHLGEPDPLLPAAI